MPPQLTCPRCHSVQPFGKQFCRNCGKPLAAQVQSIHSAPTKSIRSKQLPIIAILLALIIVIGGIVALIKFRKNDTATIPSSATSTPLTIDGVRNLISHWVSAQNSKNLRAYQSCYGVSFEGIKRTTSGRSYAYDFNGWMGDRWDMIEVAVGLNVEVQNINVRILGDTAIVEFDQYYRSKGYSDWGPKVMWVKMTPAGEKIVYEELKKSYPL